MNISVESIRIHKGLLNLVLMCLAAFFVMEWIALSRFGSGRWYLADVGNIWGCLANTMHGRFMWSPMMEVNHFSCHFTPWLLLLAPLTWFSGYPIPLVTGYVLAISLCPVPLYILAKRAGLPSSWALLLGWLFLCNIYVGSLFLSDHFESWYVLFMLWFMAAWPRKGWRFWLPMILAFSVREDACVWVGGYALFEFLRSERKQEDKRCLFSVMTACFIWGVIGCALLWITARMNPGASNIADYGTRMAGWGIGTDTLKTLLFLALSTCGLIFFSGRTLWLCLLPIPVLLVGFPFMRELKYYYSYPFLPYLGLAMVSGAQCLFRYEKWRKPLMAVLFSLATLQWFLPTFTDGWLRMPSPPTLSDVRCLNALANFLPRDAKVTVSFGAFGSVPYRPDMLMFEKHNILPDHWVVLWPKRQIGMNDEKFVKLARGVMDEVTSGIRTEAYCRDDLLIVTPQHPMKQ